MPRRTIITRQSARASAEAAPSLSRRRIGSPRCGVTLMELLVTIGIMGLLLTIGVGFYWRMSRGFALRAAVSSIESALRGARAFAIHERSHTVVVLDPVPQNPNELIERLYALGKRTVSCWHFELSQFDPPHTEHVDGTKLKGALGQEGKLSGTAKTTSGKIGSALAFSGTGDHITVETPYLDEIRDGVFVEAYVWPDATGLAAGDRLPIVSKIATDDDGKKSGYSLALSYRRSSTQDLFWLEGHVHTVGVNAEHEPVWATASARTDALIRANEWTHVALAYMRDAKDEDGNDLGLGVVLRINGQEVDLSDVVTGSDRLRPNTAPLLIGKGDTGHFKGRLDELKIGSLVAGEEFRLPKNAEVRADPGSSDGYVHFDAEGKLDRRYHTDIARFEVVLWRDQRRRTILLRRTIQVNWLGAVEVLEQEREVQ